MLVTDEAWAASNPARRVIVRPYRAWRCMAWIGETPTFLIAMSQDVPDGEDPPDAWLVDSPDALLDVAGQLEAGTFSVLVLERVADKRRIALSHVTTIWREREVRGGGPRFWYSTEAGGPRPCWRAQLTSERPPELIGELRL